MEFLLDYAFGITVTTPTPAASTAFLKQVCLVCHPKAGQEGNVGSVFECTTAAQVAVRTDNTNATQLFNAGMAKVYILLATELDLAQAWEDNQNEFWTFLISDDFSDTDLTESAATATISISTYTNLVSGTSDTIAISGTTFTAQTGAVTLGDATFRATGADSTTAQSLVDQINGHSTASGLVSAARSGADVLLTAAEVGWDGNDITVAYSSNGSVGAVLSGLSGGSTGSMSGGAGLFLGTFDGVTGIASSDTDFLEEQAAESKRSAFFTSVTNGAKNMCFAFGKLLSNASDWKNQQYIEMPVDDEVATLGDAVSLFDERISFVLTDSQYGERLALFAAGGKAITAPYILKNLRIDMQSAALQWISLNQPRYTLKEASLLQNRIQEDVINLYITRGWIESGSILITIEDDNFTATGEISVPEPKALWRVLNNMQETT